MLRILSPFYGLERRMKEVQQDCAPFITCQLLHLHFCVFFSLEFTWETDYVTKSEMFHLTQWCLAAEPSSCNWTHTKWQQQVPLLRFRLGNWLLVILKCYPWKTMMYSFSLLNLICLKMIKTHYTKEWDIMWCFSPWVISCLILFYHKDISTELYHFYMVKYLNFRQALENINFLICTRIILLFKLILSNLW